MSLIEIVIWVFIGMVMGVAAMHTLPLLARTVIKLAIAYLLTRK